MAVIPSIEEEKISNNDNDKLSEEVSQLGELKTSVMKLEKGYTKMFPKVSPKLIKDLISRQMQFPNKLPVFTLEVFTKKVGEGGIDSNTIREHIWNTTRKIPGIYDSGTHYVTNQRLTLETLKKLNDFAHVLEVTGEYSGDSYASLGPTHERSLLPKVQHPEKVLLKVEQKSKEKAIGSEDSNLHNNWNYWRCCARWPCHKWRNSSQCPYQRCNIYIISRPRAWKATWICKWSTSRLAGNWCLSHS